MRRRLTDLTRLTRLILIAPLAILGIVRERVRERMAERCEQMTPEEREKFRQGLHDRGGRTTPLDSNQSA